MALVSPQWSLQAIPDEPWDVLVIGAGPAGSTAAAHLSRLGYRVALLERQRFPRDKVCGDILIPDALRALERLGLSERVRQMGRELQIASIFSPSRVEVGIRGQYVTLRRLQLDALLAERAVEAGAALYHGTARQLEFANGWVSCHCTTGENLRARVALVATGAHVSWLGATCVSSGSAASALAVRRYVRSPLPLDRLVFAYDRSTVPGYAWIAPLADGVFNLGCGVAQRGSTNKPVNLREMLDRFVAQFPLARELLANGELLSPLRGAFLRCGLDATFQPAIENVLAIGETMGTTYPFTGEGIGKAMESAELAAAYIHEVWQAGDLGRLREFSKRLAAALQPRYASYHAAQRWLSRPWLNDLVMRRVRKSHYLQAAFAGIVDETVNPQTVFSLGGLVKSLWR